MSNPPPYGPYPPPYYGVPLPPGGNYSPHLTGEHPPPQHHHPHHHQHHPHHPHPAGAAYYVPGAVVMPYPMYPPPPEAPPQPTYVTNYIYHTPPESAPPTAPEVAEPPQPAIAGDNKDGVEWVAATNTTSRYLEGRAVVAGHEGWDGSPLWVIRACHNQDLLPGKLSVRHSAAYVPYNGKEVSVQNIEVLCIPPHLVRWVPSGNGRVPPNAIVGGRTASGEPLYVGRARYQLSLTPGKIHPSHQTCYISFGGNEIAHKVYDVLCRVG